MDFFRLLHLQPRLRGVGAPLLRWKSQRWFWQQSKTFISWQVTNVDLSQILISKYYGFLSPPASPAWSQGCRRSAPEVEVTKIILTTKGGSFSEFKFLVLWISPLLQVEVTKIILTTETFVSWLVTNVDFYQILGFLVP
jgi:hypothetical protein